MEVIKVFEETGEPLEFYISSWYCKPVENPDAFEFDKTLNVFRTLYGSDIVFVVIAL